MKKINSSDSGSCSGIILTLLTFSFTIVLFTGCTRPPVVDIQAESEKIRQLQEEMIMAYQNKDLTKILSFYSPEAIVIAPNTPSLIGAAEISRSLEVMFNDSTLVWKDCTWTNDLIEVSAGGDLAYVTVSAITPVITPDGIREINSKGVDIWKKINGEWKAVIDTWNNQKPDPGY